MSLVSDLINLSFLDLGVIAPGESITTSEQSDAFLRLNQILDSWSAEQLSTYEVLHQALNLTPGTDIYTFGVGGTLGATSPPVRVTGAASVSGTFRHPVKVVSWDEFDANAADDLGSTSILAKVIAADNAWPLINVRVFPVPAAGAGVLQIDYWTVLMQFATVGTTVTMPSGFFAALHWELAVQLFPQYARPGGTLDVIAANASKAKEVIVALNAAILGKQMAPPPEPAPQAAR